jgi:hypothetical protein
MKRRTVNDPSVGRASVGRVDDSSGAIELASRGIGEVQASDLRSRLGAFAEDWNRPEMARYDDLPSCDAAQRETTGDGGMWEGELGQGKKGRWPLLPVWTILRPMRVVWQESTALRSKTSFAKSGRTEGTSNKTPPGGVRIHDERVILRQARKL